MTVYVDASVHRYRGMLMCHMLAPDEAELHAMAEKIGVQRRWFQDPIAMPKVSRPHYDIAKSKRALAVTVGAVEVDRYQMVVVGYIALNRFYGARGIGQPIDPMWALRDHWEFQRVEAWVAAQGLAEEVARYAASAA
jgi:hypothetical protein